MSWVVSLHDAFAREFDEMEEAVQDELLAKLNLLKAVGPQLGRPHADTLSGSRHANMKELRFTAAGGVWRTAFAFDPERQAIVLVAGDKAGTAQKRYYKTLIAKADRRYDDHLATIAGKKE